MEYTKTVNGGHLHLDGEIIWEHKTPDYIELVVLTITRNPHNLTANAGFRGYSDTGRHCVRSGRRVQLRRTHGGRNRARSAALGANGR